MGRMTEDGSIAVEETLLGHLLKANDPATQRAVDQRLATDPAAVRDLARLRRALAPLEADRADIDPPADLWVRTLNRVAGHMVATEGPAPREAVRTEDVIRQAAVVAAPVPVAATITPAPPVRESALPPARRWNVVAVVGLSLSVVALVLPTVMHVREKQHQLACQNGMREFYQAAVQYTDQNDGRFPQVPAGQPAAVAAATLQQAGYLPPDVRITCPSAPPGATTPSALASYAYTLGFWDERGQLRGVDRAPGNDQMPILADAPVRRELTAVPVNHRRGQNVLFAGGNVRFCTTTNVGLNADDIFYNRLDQVGAGLGRDDAVLGRPEERP